MRIAGELYTHLLIGKVIDMEPKQELALVA